MNRSLMWRGILILGVLVLSAWAVWPPEEKINLGLDLQGGVHLVLQVKTEDALRAEVDGEMERLVRVAEDDGVPGLTPRRTGDTAFVVTGFSAAQRDKVAGYADRFLPDFTVGPAPGGGLLFQLKGESVSRVRQLAVTQALQTIRNRIDEFGVTEPVIQETSDYRIVVQLPGVDDPERIRRLIKNTAFLEFRLTRFPQAGGGVPTREEILRNFNGQLPPDVEILEGDEKDKDGRVLGKLYYAVEKKRVITGRDLRSARPSIGDFGQPVVLFTLTPAGAEIFGETTGKSIGTGLAIVLDGRVVSAPVINARIDAEGIIEGRFTQQEVDDLSTVLRSGALPAGITYLEERSVGPSLGRDSIEAGLKAGVIGTLLVVLYILIIYNLSGLNAVAALGLNILILFGGLAGFGIPGLPHATLTLPGIAGVLLTIGMAVDANVLIFERIREELRIGRTVRSAIDQGFDKALSSIIDSNVTTLVAAVFLFQFGTGPIRGFAVTLFIGLLASMFTAIFVSRWLFDMALSYRPIQRLSI
jgi:preprotein translocase subunit SecD